VKYALITEKRRKKEDEVDEVDEVGLLHLDVSNYTTLSII